MENNVQKGIISPDSLFHKILTAKELKMSNLNNTALIIIDVQKGLFEKATPVYNADTLHR